MSIQRTTSSLARAGRSAALWGTVALGLGAMAQPAMAAIVLNGDFENPDRGPGTSFAFVDPTAVAGWETTDSHIEIWANGFNGVTSYEGTQHAEINAKKFGTLHQAVSGIEAGSDVVLQFAHRARVGTDAMRVDVTDLGGDDAFDTADDTVLFSQVVSATTEAWVFTSTDAFQAITALGGDLRLSFTAVSTGSGSVSIGNFLDAVDLKVSPPAPVPVPATGGLIVGALGALGLWRRRARRG